MPSPAPSASSAAPPADEMIIGIGPFGSPHPRLVAAVCRTGALGVLDLGTGGRRARAALALVDRWTSGRFGVRVSGPCALEPADLPERAGVVLLGADAPWRPADLPGRHVLVEVTDLASARAAVAAGATGLVARGNEAGGPVGELSTFVLLQQLLVDDAVPVPVWAAGGIGEHTAAAAVTGGAAGVVLDTQLALLAEAEPAPEVRAALDGVDGSETAVVDGRRVLRRRGPGHDSALPVGQDGFVAARFARRWGTVAATVRGLREAVADAVCGAGTGDSLRSGAPLSAVLGTALPVAQGPMTRVSDRAEFAAAVAGGGALPFVALALSDGDRTRALLTETAAALGDRPWGVGVLGFAAEETRAAQLEVIRELRPSHVIIAGGRPSQAAALDAVGISTFLHVPSPGLLSQFLDSGARRFVFEGAECGGHVGPRNSFPLWEAQLDVLADAPDAVVRDVEVLFAGGIHDARSSAMVAAAAAPLTARGAKVGVLMGTAYLTTEEAVSGGAIGPLFQDEVLAAEATALLETAPGHATRCVLSPFTAEYERVRATLGTEGVPEREAWERLERLNVGRLRLASKGVERHGADLLTVDPDRQRAEGMFMAGEVAVLRSAVTTVAELHADVTSGAVAHLADRAEALRARLGRRPEPAVEAPPPLDIAVVGMAGMFPQAADLDRFWANVLAGVDAITEVPAERWDTGLYHAEGGGPDRSTSKWGGFLPEIPFDPLRYGIPPTSLSGIEPVQLLALEAARRALVDAGYGERAFDRSRTSVVFGAEAGSDLANATTVRAVLPAYVGELPPELADQLPSLTEDSFPGMLANVIAGRIANRLDLGGANYTVDAACASSLAAVDAACKELAAGTSDLVLAGGADLHNGINDYLLFSSVHALSPTGRSRAFDADADGIALGEGVACVVLKRLADAERDGDRVYAVIKGVGSASDGRSLGLTAPRPEGQRAALERAYRNARVSPAEVGLLEAHGTGTVVGDRAELTTLTAVFSEAGATPGSCVLGSVKSQIGHTKCAAGMAGLIKAALALHTGVLPPTLHVTRPSVAWDRETSPFAFHGAARPWARPVERRVAGVSAFGFGGTNFHVVLRAHDDGPPPAAGLAEWPAELFLFRGEDDEAAARSVRWLLDLVEAGHPRLRDLALAASRRADGRSAPARIAVVARDVEHLTGLLRRALAGERDEAAGLWRAEAGSADPGRVAFLFPGQGSQRPGMFAEVFTAFPELQRHLPVGDVADAVWPPAAFDPAVRTAQADRLTDTTRAQPALGAAGLAAADLLARAGVRPDVLAGHSYGELVALAVAGALAPEDMPALSEARARAVVGALGEDPGTMAAVSADAATVTDALRAAGLDGSVLAANLNSPRQTVVSGPTADVLAAVDRLRDSGLGAKRLPVACAFHSPLVAGAGEVFAETLRGADVRAPELPVLANRTAAAYPAAPDAVRAELAAQLGSPVRFAEQVEAMYADGVRTFVEAGPGSVLSGLVSATLGDRPHTTVPVQGRAAGLPGLLTALARLALAGVPVGTGWLFAGRAATDASVPDPGKPAGWTVNGHLVRTAGGDVPAGALRPARRITTTLGVGTMNGQQPRPELSGSDALVAEFLRTGRDLVASQRDVLLAYLGGAAPGAPAVTFAPPAPLTSVPVALLPVAPVPVVSPPPVPEPEPEPERLDEAGVLRTVLDIISARTGYPTDMIEPDLDLEADLSIDSIKRAEIAGELSGRLGIGTTGSLSDEELEDLSRARTAAGIAGLLVTRLGPDPAAAPVATPEPVAAEPGPADPEPVVAAPKRLVLAPVPLPPVGDRAGLADLVAGHRFAVLGGGPVAEALAARLAGLGAEPRPGGGHADGVFVLDALTAADAVLPDVFEPIKAALAGRPRWLVVAGAPGEASDGLRGLLRSVAREYPDTVARLVVLDPGRDRDELVDDLLGELLAGGDAPVVTVDGAGRHGLVLTDSPLGAAAASGAGPAGDGAAEARAIGLDRDSVVLLVGGARGITARFALALASASRCRIELAGRTPLPTGEDEDPAIAAAGDATALRAAIVASGVRSPAEVERAVGAVLARREITSTLDALRALGSPARYQSVDARDTEAVRRLVKDVHTEHGRLDGIVHAAGVIEDRLIADKDAASFRRVFDTKVNGARTLLDAAADLPNGPGFAVLFGSIAAALGNRGQSDYAAANDALEAIGARWAERTGRRGLTVHWGPWAPVGEHGGMVGHELMRSYARRGISLIDPEEGTLSLLRELAWGDPATDAVVYTASGW